MRPSRPEPKVGAWSVKAASVTGASHRKINVHCQDAHCYLPLPNGVLVAAVADGAGTAKRAEDGARIAAKTAVTWLAEQKDRLPPAEYDFKWQILLRGAFNAALVAVENEAARVDGQTRDFASTLILMLASDKYVVGAQIGDGAIVVAENPTKMFALTTPQRGEYLNETVFLHSEGAIKKAQIRVWSGKPECVAMFTDGLQMLALTLPAGNPHAPFFSPLWKFAKAKTEDAEGKAELTTFLQSTKISARASDDLTLLLANLKG